MFLPLSTQERLPFHITSPNTPNPLPADSCWGWGEASLLHINAEELFYLGSMEGPFSFPLGPATLLLSYVRDSEGTGRFGAKSLPTGRLAGLHTFMNGELTLHGGNLLSPEAAIMIVIPSGSPMPQIPKFYFLEP